MEDIPGCHVLIFPSPIRCMLLILLLLLLLLLVHQFAGLCIQQKQMGNICPGRPALPPGPRITCAWSVCWHTMVALLLYSDKPFFGDCRSQRGQEWSALQAWPRSGSERTRMHVSRPHLGHLRVSMPGIPVCLLSRAPAFPELCYCRLESNEILLLYMT